MRPFPSRPRYRFRPMLLRDLVETSAAVGATSGRLEKIARLAGTLARLGPEEVEIGVAYLSGELRQRQIGVGWASLRARPLAAREPTLTLVEVDAACARIGAASGPGSQGVRRAALAELFGRATEAEQEFLVRLLLGDLRQGALAGVMADAVARAAGVPLKAVRRALMLRADLGAVAAVALSAGVEGLEAVGLEVGRPVQPMLASTAPDVEAALAKM